MQLSMPYCVAVILSGLISSFYLLGDADLNRFVIVLFHHLVKLGNPSTDLNGAEFLLLKSDRREEV